MTYIAQLLAAMLLQASPPQMPADPRIQTFPYSSDAVVPLIISPGYAAVIELSPGERVDTVVVGNSSVWQITETGNGDRLVVKPLSGAVPTNMVVMSDARRYVFLLDPGGNQNQSSFVVRFAIADGTRASETAPQASYKFKGDRSLFPVAMRDDGKATRVRWAKQTPLPAIVAVGNGRAEALVNGRMVGNDYVIEGTAAQFKFRYGDAEAIAVRQVPRRSKK